MTLPALKGWTFVSNVGATSQAIVTKTSVPFERLQATGVKTVEDLVSLFNRFVDRVISATTGSRSVPFGAGGTVLVGVSFVAGTPQSLPHRLDTPNVHAIFGVPSAGVALASFSADAKNATFVPSTNFTCDVYLLAFP